MKHNYIKLIYLTGLLICMVCEISALSIKRYVRNGATGNGTSWQNACGSIQNAIDDVAPAGQGTVYIATARYNESVKIPVQSTGVHLIGGLSADGKDTIPDFQKNPVIIQGDFTVDYFCRDIRITGIEIHKGGLKVMNSDTYISDCKVVDGNGLYVRDGLDQRGGKDLDTRVIVDRCSAINCVYGIQANNAIISSCIIMGNKGIGLKVSGGEVYYTFVRREVA